LQNLLYAVQLLRLSKRVHVGEDCSANPVVPDDFLQFLLVR
jgi:hypothetical protein